MQEEYHHIDMELPYIIVVQPLLVAKFIEWCIYLIAVKQGWNQQITLVL